MTNNNRVEFYLKFVRERHTELQNMLNNLFHILVGEDLAAKKRAADGVLQKAKDLNAGIPADETPSWLKNIIQVLEQFIKGSCNQQKLIDYLIKNQGNIYSHNWSFQKSDENSFDFDSIFEHYKKESRIPELFNQIINILEDIQNSGEIDSIAMMTALEKVISTLKHNKDASYLSINSAWSFLMSFLENYMWAELSKIPIIGTAMVALKETIEETDREISKLHKDIEVEMQKTVESNIKGLNKKSEFPFLSYDERGLEKLGNPKLNMISEKI